MNRLVYTLFTLIILLVFVACSSNDESKETESNGDVVEIEHELGTTTVPLQPENVVVFDFGVLDTFDQLEIDVAGLPQMNLPSYLEKYAGDEYENVGTLKEPDFEKVAEINPDLIIISARQAELIDQFEEIGPTVYLGLDTTRYLDSFYENTSIIGALFDKEEEVANYIDEIEASISDVQAMAEETGKNALIVLANDDKISAYGPNSRFGIIHDVLNIPAVDEGIEVSTHGMNVSFEYVADKNPDILYVIDRTAAIGEGEAARQILDNRLVERTSAFTNDDIYILNPDYWYLSGGGIESTKQMINEIEASLK